MKNRFLALLICAILVFSIIPFGKNIKASQTNNNAKQLNKYRTATESNDNLQEIIINTCIIY